MPRPTVDPKRCNGRICTCDRCDCDVQAAYDAALADVLALPEVKALTREDWAWAGILSSRPATSQVGALARLALAVRKLCTPGNPGEGSATGGGDHG